MVNGVSRRDNTLLTVDFNLRRKKTNLQQQKVYPACGKTLVVMVQTVLQLYYYSFQY